MTNTRTNRGTKITLKAASGHVLGHFVCTKPPDLDNPMGEWRFDPISTSEQYRVIPGK